MKKTASTEVAGYRIEGGQDAKKEMLDEKALAIESGATNPYSERLLSIRRSLDALPKR